jgi:hypothetical protein
MEKLKPLIKHHFWILTVVVVLATIGVGVWAWMAAGDLINRQKTDILSAETKAKNVLNVRADVADAAAGSVHPNQDTIQGMSKEIESGKSEVLAAWTKLFDEQKAFLAWPGDILPPNIAKPFDAVRPEQLKFDPNSRDVIVNETIRKQIRQLLPNFMPFLVNSVRAKWSEVDVTGETGKVPAVAAVAAEAPSDDMEKLMFDEPLVEWALGDQIKWYNQLTNFKGNGNQSIDGTPTTIQVVYLKEDLMLLNGILEIIRESNQNAVVPSQTAIREINNIMIGKEAHEAKPLDVGSAVGGGASGAMGEAAGRMDMMRQYMEGIMNGGEKEETVVSASDAEKMDPANMRYVDKDFKPIEAGKYRQSVSSTQLGADSWMMVVKRVPVRLRLRVDERRIPEILEKCANAKIPLEVRQITLIGGELPADPVAEAGAGGTGTKRRGPTGMTSGSGASAALTDDDERPSGQNQTGLAGSAGEEKTYQSPEFNSHFLVPLEIYGVMKFYSVPSPEALGQKASASSEL